VYFKPQVNHHNHTPNHNSLDDQLHNYSIPSRWWKNPLLSFGLLIGTIESLPSDSFFAFTFSLCIRLIKYWIWMAYFCLLVEFWPWWNTSSGVPCSDFLESHQCPHGELSAQTTKKDVIFKDTYAHTLAFLRLLGAYKSLYPFPIENNIPSPHGRVKRWNSIDIINEHTMLWFVRLSNGRGQTICIVKKYSSLHMRVHTMCFRRFTIEITHQSPHYLWQNLTGFMSSHCVKRSPM
jgi:hypothetical protein